MKNIFISSTFEDLKDYREQVVKSIRQLGLVDISMENFGARDARPKDECKRIIEQESNIFVGIYAHRYGFIPPNETISITEAEFNWASAANLPRFLYVIDDNVSWVPGHIDQGQSKESLTNFKNRISNQLIFKHFSDKYDLSNSIACDLGRHYMQTVFQSVTPSKEDKNMAISDPKNPDEWSSLRNRYYDRGICLVHTLWPSETPDQEYDIYIYLIPHKDANMDEVTHAEFFLGKWWDNKIFTVQNGNNDVGIYASAYGPFLCLCKVHFKDGKSTMLYRYIDFEHGKLYFK